MNDNDSRCIHIERDGKAIEFGDLNIPSTDRNTSYADGLVSIFDGNLDVYKRQTSFNSEDIAVCIEGRIFKSGISDTGLTAIG